MAKCVDGLQNEVFTLYGRTLIESSSPIPLFSGIKPWRCRAELHFKRLCGLFGCPNFRPPASDVTDEKTLNAAGDLATVALMRSLSIEAMETPQNKRQVLLILRFAFEAPDLIAGCNRNPTATLILLDHLESVNHGTQDNELNNTKFLVKHNATTGRLLAPTTGESPIDWEHTKWVDSVLRWTIFIKPGMTRKDVLSVFTTEGGLSNRHQRTYVLKQCPYIKVDVEFSPVGDAQNLLAESPDDKIIKISRPYLQYSTMD